MKWKKFDQYHVVRLERDEEIISALTHAARSAGIEGGFFYGLGVGKDLELGYFDAHNKNYVRKKFDDEYEFTNIVGNISLVEGELTVHCHVTIADAEFNTFGGHLFSGTVPATLELIIFPFTQPLVRSHDLITGLKLLKL